MLRGALGGVAERPQMRGGEEREWGQNPQILKCKRKQEDAKAEEKEARFNFSTQKIIFCPKKWAVLTC